MFPFVTSSPEHLPLAHRLILVTRNASQSPTFSTMLQAQGAIVREMPTLEIGAPSSWEPLDQAIVALPRFQWLILTSVNGVEAFFQRLQVLQNQALPGLAEAAAHLSRLKIAAVGQKTADRLQEYGYAPAFVPTEFVADALVSQFPDPLSRVQILFPRVESGGRDVLVQAFREQGATIVEVPAYESRCPAAIATEALTLIESGAVHVVTFASSKTVLHFCQLLHQALGDSWRDALGGVALASIGPQTSQTCRERLGRVEIEAEEYTLEGLTEAIVAYFRA